MDDSLIGCERPVFDTSCQAGFGVQGVFTVFDEAT